MSETPTPPAPPVPFGQALGEAYHNVHGLQLRLLEHEQSSFLEWVVMNISATDTSPVAADHVSTRLANELSIDRSVIDDVVSSLRSHGHLSTVDVDGVTCLDLTPKGRARYLHLRASIRRATAELLDTFDEADITRTTQVLIAVRERAPLVPVG